MSEKESQAVYAGAVESQQKFDYFVAGVAGTLFAYIGQTYTPKMMAINFALLEPLSLLFLAVAFYLGMKRIENTSIIMRLNHEMLDYNEKAGNMTAAMFNGRGDGYNVHTGDIINHAELPFRRDEYRRLGLKAEGDANDAIERGGKLYVWRNRFLITGFASIFLSKVLLPYV